MRSNFYLSENKRNEEYFYELCENGKLYEAMKICIEKNILDVSWGEDAAFTGACDKGHIKVAKWLYSHFDIDIYADDEKALVGSSYNGHLEIVKWLCSIGTYDEYHNGFCVAINNGQDNILKFFRSRINIIKVENSNKFIELCKKGLLEEAIKMYNDTEVDIHYNNDDAFQWACESGHVEVAKWSYSLVNT